MSDHFVLLQRGRTVGDFAKSEITMPELTQAMSGGAEMEALQHELHDVLAEEQPRVGAPPAGIATPNERTPSAS